MAQSVGLSEAEWNHLLAVLERQPSIEELQMIGVQWSEHCSYKSSKKHLKKIISQGGSVVQGPGENAGLVNLDDRRAIAFKVESHNHPSYVEPFQGAATGVGGILRDIFTMGARPHVLGNYLRFGDFKNAKQQYLLNGVVSGISHYGNCVGVPTLGGQVHSDPSYESNILVNVFALGLVDKDKVFKSDTASAQQSIMVWGAKTGRDGIHGASLLASADFEEQHGESKEQKIRVQVGDPFKEKCLMEATLECMEKLGSKITAIQDMGAAGLTCSTLEISDKSKVGMRIELDRVPAREDQMEAYELLLSESQERMLAVVEKGSEKEFKEILHKWECAAETIGETTGDGLLKISYRGEQVVNLPVSRLMDPPEPELPSVEAAQPLFDVTSKQKAFEVPSEPKEEWLSLRYLLSLPRIASKAALYQQYDSSVGGFSVSGPSEASAGVILASGEGQQYLGVAFKGAWDEDYASKNPRYAAQAAMAECYRALACVGAKALGITDGVNLGNPNTPKVQKELSQIVEGMNDAISVFDTPCVSGNVSLYNQTQLKNEARDIKPTTFIVMVGKVEDVRRIKPANFQKPGSEVWLVEVPGNSQKLPHSSVYSRVFWKNDAQDSQMPHLNLQSEKLLALFIKEALEEDLCESIRPISDGGLAVCLAESCFQSEKTFGFEGDWSKYQDRRDFLLFNESGGRVVLEIEPSKRALLMKLGMKHKLETKRIGTVVEENIFRIRPLLSGPISELQEAWSQCFEQLL